MSNLFKTRFVPNSDGSDSGSLINNSNSVFVHTYVGDDFTGDGTREYPFKSAFKANQKSGVSYIIFRGVINESVSYTKVIIGDDMNQNIITSNFSSIFRNINKLTIDSISSMDGAQGVQVWNCIVNYSSYYYNGNWQILNPAFSLFKNLFTLAGTNGNENPIINNCTFKELNHSGLINYTYPCIINSLCFSAVNFITNKQANYSYTVFLSTCIFKYNAIPVIQPIWTNDSRANMQLIRNAYLVAGMSQSNVDLIFFKDSFGNETCRIVKEERNGGTTANIFNQYDVNGNVLDYTLNPQSNNEALYASNLGGYVGCFKPASAMVNTMWNTPIDVNVDGSDTINAGTLLRVNSDQSIDFNSASSQIWNRIKSNTVLAIPNGIKFNGVSIMSTDGSAFGYYFGKHQNLMNVTALTPSDVLEVNSIYKVCNINRDIYSSVVFNGTQYLPDYFFKTGTSVLNFTLLNTGSGTVVKKVLATPLEGVEIIPYDDLTTPSVTFPRFSCPLSGNVLMLFHKIGVNIDKPVLFSEVTNDKIAYYATWAVTNADQEFVTLALDTVNYYYKTPVLKFLLPALNAHFNVDYDQ